MKTISQCHLYGILDLGYIEPRQALAVTRQMLDGGIDILQLRAKKLAPEATTSLAQVLKQLTGDVGVPLIINDHPEPVPLVRAEGVHVGQEDLPVAEARQRATAAGGIAPIVGKSTHSIDQAKAAEAEGADYIGFGPIFSTPTKPDYEPIGTSQIKGVHEQVQLPVFCIGGIKLENLASLVAAGARRVVIVSGILLAPDRVNYIRQAKAILEKKV